MGAVPVCRDTLQRRSCVGPTGRAPVEYTLCGTSKHGIGQDGNGPLEPSSAQTFLILEQTWPCCLAALKKGPHN